MKQHPSGRPITETKPKLGGYYRIPHDGFITPRLQRRELQAAVGFTSGYHVDPDEYYECKKDNG